MRPYNCEEKRTKGLACRRRSHDTPHRKRSLRTDKRSARQKQKEDIINGLSNYLNDEKRNS